jgi:citrate lyase alpha subunit
LRNSFDAGTNPWHEVDCDFNANVVSHSGLPICDLRDIQHPVAVVKWVDGSLLDTVYRVKT